MKKTAIRIATRRSALALWQANHIKNLLEQYHPYLKIELLGITTEGDKNLSPTLNKVGGKGLFVKELEQAILTKQAEIAVHSMKDVPREFAPGLGIAAISRREDARDCFISNHFSSVAELPLGAVIGTSSLRRASQLRKLRPDISIEPLRGNIDTRIRRLDEGKFTAIVLAAAGVKRLGLTHRIAQYFDPDEFLPAVGQGALGIECQLDDHFICDLVQVLDDEETYTCVSAERSLNDRLGGGCHVPIGAFAYFQGTDLKLKAMVGMPDGSQILTASGQTDNSGFAESLGIEVAEKLLAQGAQAILENL